MKSSTEIHSNSAIELQVYHLITCYHNFCIRSLLSRQQSFPLQVKRICRDSSFVTLMSFSAKLSLPARFFSHCFGSQGRTLNYFCNRLRTAKRYVTWLVSNHDRSNRDRRIMTENPGVYIAMKSAVIAIQQRRKGKPCWKHWNIVLTWEEKVHISERPCNMFHLFYPTEILNHFTY